MGNGSGTMLSGLLAFPGGSFLFICFANIFFSRYFLFRSSLIAFSSFDGGFGGFFKQASTLLYFLQFPHGISISHLILCFLHGPQL